MSKIILAVMVACVVAATSPVNAAGRLPQNADRPLVPFAVAPLGPEGDKPISAARAAAVRACIGEAQPYAQNVWGVTEIMVYRACMARHGQAE